MIPGDDDMIMTKIRGGGINKRNSNSEKKNLKKVPLEKVNKRNQ